MKRLLALPLAVAVGCAGLPTKYLEDYTAFRAAAPRSILILPPLNSSSFEAADEVSRAILTVGVGNRGYYVYPTSAVDRALERAGIGAAEAHAVDPRRLHALSGCDAVLSLKIDAWEEHFHHRLIDSHARLTGCESGEVLWERQRRGHYSTEGPSSTPNSLRGSILEPLFELADALSADPEDFVAGGYLVDYLIRGYRGLPAGPYPVDYMADFDYYPSFPPSAPWRRVTVLDPGQAPPEGATALGPVRGLSCGSRVGEARTDIARRELRAQVAAVGGNVVSSPACAKPYRAFALLCQEVIACDGDAFATADPEPDGTR